MVIIVASIEQAKNSIMLNQFQKPNKPLALVFGNEVYGVEQEVINQSDACIEIPQFGTKHSFNVSVSMGIVLWEMLTIVNSDVKRDYLSLRDENLLIHIIPSVRFKLPS
jgi:23S rRNA (guanosine2251-2'-O)-methyltransferase